MESKSRRKQLVEEYRQTRPEAGVYRIVNRQTGKMLLESSANLASVHAKLAFGQKTESPGVFGYKIAPDIRQYGIGSFELEILEVLDTTPEMTQAEILADLNALEQLWREKYDPSTLY